MRRYKKHILKEFLPLAAIITVFFSCEQRPLDLVPQTPDLTWTTLHQLGDRRDLVSLWGSSSNDIYMGCPGIRQRIRTAGRYPATLLFHFDGAAWEEVEFRGSEYSYDMDIWGSGPNDVYVADGRLFHFDGNTWSEQLVKADVVGGTGPDDVYAAYRDSIYHFDGTYWELLYETERWREVRAVWAGPGPSLVLVRSYDVVQWDGTRWWTTDLGEGLFDIWGVAADDLYLVGCCDAIWHYDGSDWSEMSGPEGRGSFTGVWGTAPDDVYAVGIYGQIFHFDGLSWELIGRPTNKRLNDIWGTSQTDIYAVGDYEKVLHFDGTSWTSEREDKPFLVEKAWAESKTRLAVVSPSDHGNVYIFDGTRWKETYTKSHFSLYALGGSAINDLFVSAGRTIRHFDGSEWSVSADNLYGEQLAFWTTSSNDIFSVGTNSIYRYNGSVWNAMIEDGNFFGTGNFELLSVWGSSRSNVFAVGGDWGKGIVVRYDGDSWTRMDCDLENPLLDVWGTSPKDVFAVGYDGIFQYDGRRWVSQAYYVGAWPQWVGGRAPDLVIAGGYDVLMQYDGVIWNSRRMDTIAKDVFNACDGTIIRVDYDGISYCEE